MPFLQSVTVPKTWGREIVFVNTRDYCGKRLEIDAGQRIGLHRHLEKDETFFVQSGMASLWILPFDTTILALKKWSPREAFQKIHTEALEKDDVFRVHSGTWHSIMAHRHTSIYEFSTHHSEKDTERLRDFWTPEQLQAFYGD